MNKEKPVWLTFSVNYLEFKPMGYYGVNSRRFAVKMKNESVAKRNWINNFGLDVNINHCGKFRNNTIVLNEDGHCVKNEHLLCTNELNRFHQTLMAGIQIGKEINN